MVVFRCPHNGPNGPEQSHEGRVQRREMRRTEYEVPEDAEWVAVREPDPDNPGEMRLVGTFKTQVVCPDCGATLKIVTDQEV